MNCVLFPKQRDSVSAQEAISIFNNVMIKPASGPSREHLLEVDD